MNSSLISFQLNKTRQHCCFIAQLFVLLFIILQLQACGQKGDLYLPVDEQVVEANEMETQSAKLNAQSEENEVKK